MVQDRGILAMED